MAKNEIEARIRWTHGSRQAGSVGRASPPNFSAGRGGGMGPRGIPVGLSGANVPGALSAYRACRMHRLLVGACLYRFFIFKIKNGGH